jgi:hypothetical protein
MLLPRRQERKEANDLGIFYERALHPGVENAIRESMGDESRSADELVTQLQSVGAGNLGTRRIQWNRLLISLGILGAVVIGAVATEAADLTNSSDALWGMTASLLGLIVGLLGGETAAS